MLCDMCKVRADAAAAVAAAVGNQPSAATEANAALCSCCWLQIISTYFWTASGTSKAGLGVFSLKRSKKLTTDALLSPKRRHVPTTPPVRARAWMLHLVLHTRTSSVPRHAKTGVVDWERAFFWILSTVMVVVVVLPHPSHLLASPFFMRIIPPCPILMVTASGQAPALQALARARSASSSTVSGTLTPSPFHLIRQSLSTSTQSLRAMPTLILLTAWLVNSPFLW